MNIEFGLFSTKVTTEEERCRADDCFRIMAQDDPCFVDVQNNKVLCPDCGKCERYARKKQEEREKRGITEIPLIKGLDY